MKLLVQQCAVIFLPWDMGEWQVVSGLNALMNGILVM